MNNRTSLRLLFVINPASGTRKLDYPGEIKKYLAEHAHNASYFIMPLQCRPELIKKQISEYRPDIVIACGGDGTIKLVAESVFETKIPLGIIPAGSANGLAKELNIPLTIKDSMDIILHQFTMPVSMIRINTELCIHLSDIGFNAFVIKKFESGKGRGMWGYFKAAWQVLLNHSKMQAKLFVNNRQITRKASMIVIANATRYGSGALINPLGRLDDDVFEVILVKKISFMELFKMVVTHKSYDPRKTELFQTSSLQIQSRHKAHFQVDGEYIGKTYKVEATIIPGALTVIVPKK
jgi:diacylglycerol kinase family enzyme